MAHKDEEQISFNINQVAKIIGVVPATIRNWEKNELFSAKRKENNYRVFDFNDIELLKRIKKYSADEHMTISMIKRLTSKDNSTTICIPKKYYKKIYNAKLKEFREKAGYTLEDVSKEVGISPSYLSRIEQGCGNVSFDILDRLATFYGESTLYFFDIKSEHDQPLVKRGKGKPLGTGLLGVTIESLTNSVDTIFEVSHFTVEPGCGDFKSHSHKSGEEFIYVLSGKIQVVLDNKEQYLVTDGDSIHFMSSRQHRWDNPGKKTALLIWVHSYM